MAGGGHDGGRRGLLLDYGGVLTTPVGDSFAAFEREHGIEPGRTFEVLLEASRVPGGGPIGALERGEMPPAEFERVLADALRAAGDRPPDGSLLEGLFGRMRPTGRLWDLAARARAAGVRTGLLSNSWGTGAYPRDRLAGHFDAVVISGEVGLRKPDPAIYLLAAERLGLEPGQCVFVDDLERNVRTAREVGMSAVHHRGDEDEVVAAVTRRLGLEPDV